MGLSLQILDSQNYSWTVLEIPDLERYTAQNPYLIQHWNRVVEAILVESFLECLSFCVLVFFADAFHPYFHIQKAQWRNPVLKTQDEIHQIPCHFPCLALTRHFEAQGESQKAPSK